MYLLFAGYFMDYCSLLDGEICCLGNCGVTSLVCMLNVWRLLHKFNDVCCKTACCWDVWSSAEFLYGVTYFCHSQWKWIPILLVLFLAFIITHYILLILTVDYFIKKVSHFCVGRSLKHGFIDCWICIIVGCLHYCI